jgi:hypothetical protein
MLAAFSQWCCKQRDAAIGCFRGGPIRLMHLLGFWLAAALLIVGGAWGLGSLVSAEWQPSQQPMQVAAEANAPAASQTVPPASEQEPASASKPEPEPGARSATPEPEPARTVEAATEAASSASPLSVEQKSPTSEPNASSVTKPTSESDRSSAASEAVSKPALDPGSPRPASEPRAQDTASAPAAECKSCTTVSGPAPEATPATVAIRPLRSPSTGQAAAEAAPAATAPPLASESNGKFKHKGRREHARNKSGNPLSRGWKSFRQSFKKGLDSLFREKPYRGT